MASSIDALTTEHICRCIDSIQTLDNMITALPQCKNIVERVKSDLYAKWDYWLVSAPKLDIVDTNKVGGSSLDSWLKDFCLGDETRIITAPISGVQRMWVHKRAAQLGLSSSSNRYKDYKSHGNIKPMTLVKSADWKMPWEAAHPIPPPPPNSTTVLKAARRAKFDAWRTSCNECGKELDVHTALYHWGGMGPLCDDCIEADPELQGLKWEPKCDFWY